MGNDAGSILRAKTKFGFSDIDDKESRDLAAKRNLENDVDSALYRLHHKAQKAAEIPLFRRHFDKFETYFSAASDIVELGGGSGWASHYVKTRLPRCSVYNTDISPEVAKLSSEWDGFFGTSLDGSYCAKSYDLPFAEKSIDLAFTFQAAHHFGRHKTTFKELKRILRPGGVCLYLDEPVCGRTIYPLALRRVNRRMKQDGVPEDVIVYNDLLNAATAQGFKGEVLFDNHTINRGSIETIYYSLLSTSSLLSRVLPATACFVFRSVANE